VALQSTVARIDEGSEMTKKPALDVVNDNVDEQLRARPPGPGRLYLCLNRGSEVFLAGYGWMATDPADVRKVALEEPPGNLAVNDPKVVAARKTLFGAWEGNWLVYNFAHDVALPGSSGPKQRGQAPMPSSCSSLPQRVQDRCVAGMAVSLVRFALHRPSLVALLGRLGTLRTPQVAEASSGRFPQPLLMRSGQARPLIPQYKVKRRSM